MTLLLVLAMAIVAVLALVGLDLLVRRPVLGAWVALSMVVVEVFDPRLTSVSFAGFRISIIDVGFSLLALAAVLRLVRARGTREQALLALFGLLVVVSLIFGIRTVALDAAVNEFRSYLGFVSAALYFSTVPLDRDTLQSIVHAWLWAGIAVAGVVVLRWAGRIAGIDLGLLDATYDATIRVLDGPATMFLASSAVVLLLSGLYGAVANPRLYQRAGMVLLPIAIILNRRTAWLALAVALIGLLIRERRIGKRAASIAVLGLAVFTLVLPFFSESDGGDRTARSTDVGTLLWRVEGWVDLLDSGAEEPAHYAIGSPFGLGYERTIGGNVQESDPHNFYIETFLRTGAVGLGVLLLVLSITFISLWKDRSERDKPLSGDVLVLLLMMQGIWCMTWSPLAEQGVILGLAAATSGRNYLARRVTTGTRAEREVRSPVGQDAWL